MARITNNTTGTQPITLIDTTAITGNGVGSNSVITLTGVENITIENSTGVHTYTTFSDVDMRKLTTPANNTIKLHIIIDSTSFYPVSGATANSAQAIGLQALSSNKDLIYFKIYTAGDSGATGSNKFVSGQGFISSLAPTTSPTAPILTTPLDIQVDGSFSFGSE